MLQDKISITETKLAFLFFKLGMTSFGGPLVHIAMMRDEMVTKRGWFNEEEFMDLVSATNLIPGPNSTELAMHIGYKALGIRGLFISGCAFIFPAFSIVLSLSVLYSNYDQLPQVASILQGMGPIIVSIIFLALMGFRKSALVQPMQFISFVCALILMWFGVNEIVVLIFSGIISIRSFRNFSFFPMVILTPPILKSFTHQSLFLYFMKLGSVLFGSGYVLFAFLKNDLVDEKMWLTSQQLVDAIAIGQMTPGPVFTSATFIGYLLSGYVGAILATIGIFLPAFIFVMITSPVITNLRSSTTLNHFMNGVNAASFALLLIVTYQLGVKNINSFYTVILFLISFILLRFTKVNSFWLLLIGGILGYIL